MPSVKKNYLYNLGYQVLALLAPLITGPYVSRVLGADGIGIFSYTSSLVTYFTLFAALGVGSYGMREISQNREDPAKASKLFWEIEIMVICTTLICLVAWSFVVIFYEQYRWCFLALTPHILAVMFDLTWFFLGYEQMGRVVLRNTLVKVLSIVLLFTLVKDKGDLVLYIAINSLTVLFANLTMWIYLPKMVQRVDFKSLRFRGHFKETLIYFIPTMATSIYTVLDRTLIGIITKDAYLNGYYDRATMVVNMGKTLAFVAVNGVMESRINYLYQKGATDEILLRTRRSMDFIFLASFAIAFGIAGVAERFVPLFFGPGYGPVVPLLYLMCPLVVIIGISNCLGSHFYTPSGRRKLSAKFIVIGSIVNLCLNIALIPFLGAYGAVIGSLCAESLITILYMHNCQGHLTWPLLGTLAWKHVIAGGLMFLAVFFFGRWCPWGDLVCVLVQIVLGGVLYVLLMLVMGDSMTKELLVMVRHLPQRLRGGTGEEAEQGEPEAAGPELEEHELETLDRETEEQ